MSRKSDSHDGEKESPIIRTFYNSQYILTWGEIKDKGMGRKINNHICSHCQIWVIRKKHMSQNKTKITHNRIDELVRSLFFSLYRKRLYFFFSKNKYPTESILKGIRE